MALHIPPVDDVDPALARLLPLGTVVHDDLRGSGGGYRGAVVIDPSGNTLGTMQRRIRLATRARASFEEAA